MATRLRDCKQRVSLHGLSLHALAPIGYAPVTLRIGLSRIALNEKHVRFHYTRLTTRRYSGSVLFESCGCERAHWWKDTQSKYHRSTILLMFLPQVDQLKQIIMKPKYIIKLQ